jgi:hypothetical protein
VSARYENEEIAKKNPPRFTRAVFAAKNVDVKKMTRWPKNRQLVRI